MTLFSSVTTKKNKIKSQGTIPQLEHGICGNLNSCGRATVIHTWLPNKHSAISMEQTAESLN